MSSKRSVGPSVRRSPRPPVRRSPRPPVPRFAEDAVRRLRALGDPERAKDQRAYFKSYETVHFFGVATPGVRAIGRDIYATIRGSWTVKDAIAFCDTLVRRRELEAKGLGILVLSRFATTFPKGLLATVKRWLREDRLATWAMVDAVAPWVIAPLIERYPEVGSTVRAWTRSRNVWVRRAAPVAFIPHARHGERLNDAYAIARALSHDDHDLIHKATGWLLREAGKTDMRRLERFLRAHGSGFSRTTVRYAIERFPANKRRQLLEATR